MTNTQKKKQTKRKNGFSPIAAVVTGAVVGAGIAVAGAVALKNEKNRKKLKKVLTNAKDQVVDYVEDVQKGTRAAVDKQVVQSKKRLKKIVKAAKS